MQASQKGPLVVAPSPTPFREDETVDHAAIERNVARWLETPLSGFVLNSENGEESFLSEQERLAVVRTVHAAVAGQRLLIAGVDCPSVTETLRLAETFAGAGATLVRIRIPRLADVRRYFEQVIPRAPAPVIIIHQMAPGTFLSGPTGVGAAAELIGELVARDNVFGYIASADLRFEARVRTFVPAHKQFWTGNGSLLLPGAVLGANGACMMLGNVAPTQCCELLHLIQEDRLSEAMRLQTSLLEADWQILSRGAAGLKAALNLLGFDAGQPRLPAVPCSPDEVELIRRGLRIAGCVE